MFLIELEKAVRGKFAINLQSEYLKIKKLSKENNIQNRLINDNDL